MSAILNLIKLIFFRAYPSPKPYILFYSNSQLRFSHILRILLSIMAANDILNFIKLTFFRAYPFLKSHIVFNSNGPAIWNSFLDIMHITDNNGGKSAFLISIELKYC